MRILIVDDNEKNRDLLKVALSAHAHETAEATNGLEALELLRTSPFDALVSDVLMPGMDGYRLCSEVRRNPGTKRLPIVLVSSIYTSPADAEVALKAGADRFLARPMSDETLLQVLREVSAAARDSGDDVPPTPAPEVLKAYSEQLITKLKEKSQALESARARLVAGNESLRRANEALAQDVSDVEHLAFHDPLTGLPNRLLFNDRLTMALSQSRRHQRKLATFFMDLDNFKAINDSMGHTAGDELLRMVADRLRTCVREEDTLARFGGDEFILLVTGILSERDLTRVSQKILDTIRPPFHVEGREIRVTISVGASVFPGDGDTPELLVRNADMAMYRSKQQGRNTYQFFTPGMIPATLEHLKLDAELRNALNAGEFVLDYQPIVDLDSGKVRAVEALLRWQASRDAPVPPADLIAFAETSDLIVPINQWVLRSACTQRAAWQQHAPPRLIVAINLAERAFQRPDVVGDVAAALTEAGLSPECVDLEITESSAMQNVEYSAATLRRLKELGVNISVDDFGTGFSSLRHLKRLPIDRIKIHRSFVRNVASDPDDAAIVSAAIAMAHRMKRTVVAEGVDAKEQLTFLTEQKCDLGQGPLFSRPLPPQAVERALRGRRSSPYQRLFQA